MTDRMAWFVSCCCCKTVTITCWFCSCSSLLISSSSCRNSRSVFAFSCMNSTSGSVRALLLWRLGFSSHSSPFSVDLRFFVSLYRSKAFWPYVLCFAFIHLLLLDGLSPTLFKLSSFPTSSSSKTSISDMSSSDIQLAVSSWCILALYFFWRRTHRSLTARLSLTWKLSVFTWFNFFAINSHLSLLATLPFLNDGKQIAR